MTAVTNFSRTAASNNSSPPDGFPEGQTPGSVNNSARELMKAIVDEATNGACKVLASVAGTNTITASCTPDITAYSAGMALVFTPANTNTAATTIAIDGLTALDILKADGAPLVGGELIAGIPAIIVLDSGGDDFLLVNPQQQKLYRRTFSGSDSTTQADAGSVVEYTGVGSHTFTVDTDISDLSVVTIVNSGSGNLTIASSGTLTFYNGSGSIGTGSRTLAVGGIATVHRIGSNHRAWGVGLT